MNKAILNKPIENSIKKKLETTLRPLYCNVINESYMHNVPKDSETHFKVVIVSEKFNKQPLIEVIIRDSCVYYKYFVTFNFKSIKFGKLVWFFFF